MNKLCIDCGHDHPEGPCPPMRLSSAPVAGSALDEQRRALAEARQRIIARCQQVEKWPRKDATDMIAANWDGIVEGLQQALRIIGAMWDELPVPLPQAVLEHNAKCAAAMGAQNDKDHSPIEAVSASNPESNSAASIG